MKCSRVRTSLSAMHDRRLREPERAEIAQHVAACMECQCLERDLRFVSLALREMPAQRPPVDLTYRLRVLASHERMRMMTGNSLWPKVQFMIHQILKPLAVPAAGGFFASLMFFAILAPSFTVHANTTNDVPVGLYTPASIVNPSPLAFDGQDVTLELTIDESNTVSDYSVCSGKLSKDEMAAIGNFLLFTSFKAATAFGQPVTSKMLLSISHTDVGS